MQSIGLLQEAMRALEFEIAAHGESGRDLLAAVGTVEEKALSREVFRTSVMTDAEIRGRLLTVFHTRRHNSDGWVPTFDINVSPDPVDP
jgi:hypothetical protein